MKRTSFLISLAFTGFLATQASAAGVPTSDVENTLQNIKQLKTMLEDAGVQADILENAVEQVNKLQEQITQLNDIYNQFSGVRDIIGMTMEGNLDGILSSNFGDILGTINAGMNGDWSGLVSEKSGPLKEGIDKALSAAGLSQDNVTSMAESDVPGAKRAANQASGGAVLAAAAEQTYSETGESLQRVDKILELSQESTDIKESIDLNTRMLAELSVQLAKSLELQSVEAVYNGQSGINSAAAIAEERKYMTFSNE